MHKLSTPPPRTTAHPGVRFLFSFDHHFITPAVAENISKSKVLHAVDTIHPQHARTGMHAGTTSMEATAAPHHGGRIESGPTGTCCCRTSSEGHVVFLGPCRQPVPVLVLPLLPWLKLRLRVTVPANRQKLCSSAQHFSHRA